MSDVDVNTVSAERYQYFYKEFVAFAAGNGKAPQEPTDEAERAIYNRALLVAAREKVASANAGQVAAANTYFGTLDPKTGIVEPGLLDSNKNGQIKTEGLGHKVFTLFTDQGDSFTPTETQLPEYYAALAFAAKTEEVARQLKEGTAPTNVQAKIEPQDVANATNSHKTETAKWKSYGYSAAKHDYTGPGAQYAALLGDGLTLPQLSQERAEAIKAAQAPAAPAPAPAKPSFAEAVEAANTDLVKLAARQRQDIGNAATARKKEIDDKKLDEKVAAEAKRQIDEAAKTQIEQMQEKLKVASAAVGQVTPSADAAAQIAAAKKPFETLTANAVTVFRSTTDEIIKTAGGQVKPVEDPQKAAVALAEARKEFFNLLPISLDDQQKIDAWVAQQKGRDALAIAQDVVKAGRSPTGWHSNEAIGASILRRAAERVVNPNPDKLNAASASYYITVTSTEAQQKVTQATSDQIARDKAAAQALANQLNAIPGNGVKFEVVGPSLRPAMTTEQANRFSKVMDEKAYEQAGQLLRATNIFADGGVVSYDAKRALADPNFIANFTRAVPVMNAIANAKTDADLVAANGLAGGKPSAGQVKVETNAKVLIPIEGEPAMEVARNERSLYLFGKKPDFTNIAQLTEVNYIDLRTSKVTDAELAKLNLPNLENLQLLRAPITGAGLTQAKMPELKHLMLDETQFNDAALGGLRAPKLEYLGLDRTQVTDAGLAHLKNFPALTSIELSRTQVTDQGLLHLKGLANLRAVDLRNTAITSAGLTNLPLGQLQYLTLDITKVTDLSPLKAATQLKGINLRNMQLNLEPLAGLAALENMNLYEAKVNDFKPLAGMTNLKELFLGGSNVTDADLTHVKGLKQLTELNLSYTNITDAGLAHVRDLPNLISLNLEGVQVGEEGKKILAEMKASRAFIKIEGVQITDAEIAAAKARLAKGTAAAGAGATTKPAEQPANKPSLMTPAEQETAVREIAAVVGKGGVINMRQIKPGQEKAAVAVAKLVENYVHRYVGLNLSQPGMQESLKGFGADPSDPNAFKLVGADGKIINPEATAKAVEQYQRIVAPMELEAQKELKGLKPDAKVGELTFKILPGYAAPGVSLAAATEMFADVATAKPEPKTVAGGGKGKAVPSAGHAGTGGHGTATTAKPAKPAPSSGQSSGKPAPAAKPATAGQDAVGKDKWYKNADYTAALQSQLERHGILSGHQFGAANVGKLDNETLDAIREAMRRFGVKESEVFGTLARRDPPSAKPVERLPVVDVPALPPGAEVTPKAKRTDDDGRGAETRV